MSIGDSIQVTAPGRCLGMTGIVHEVGRGYCNVQLDRYITRERFANDDLVADPTPPARMTLAELANAERALADECGIPIADAAALLRRQMQDELVRKESERGVR